MTPLSIQKFLTLDRDSIRLKEGKSVHGLRIPTHICEILKNILNILATKLKLSDVAMSLGFAIPGLESQTYMTSAIYPGVCGFEYLHLF